jgi:hypothetical protein
MRHGTLTLISRLRPERVEHVKRQLRQWGEEPEALFGGVPGLHFARFAVLDSGHLVFGADYTLPVSQERELDPRFLQGLLQEDHRLDAFHALYKECRDYPYRRDPAPEAMEHWLLRQRKPYGARHVELPYRVETPEGLRRLLTLRHTVEKCVNSHREDFIQLLRGNAPAAQGLRQCLGSVRRKLLETLAEQEASLPPEVCSQTYLDEPAWKQFLDEARWDMAFATLMYAPQELLARAYLGAEERVKSFWRRFKGTPPTTPRELTLEDAKREELEQQPEYPVQNPMVLLVRINPAQELRVRSILRLVDWRFRRYQVGLNDIRAIHCARWVMFDGGEGHTYLLFFSNFDDSWEAYIDSFLDHEDVLSFLKRIWSETDGFPKPGTFRGPFVTHFKNWVRQVQVPTLVWYSAYPRGQPGAPGMSVMDVHSALQLRGLLAQEHLNPTEEHALMRLLAQGLCTPERKMMTFPQVATQTVHQLKAKVPWRARRVHHGKRNIPRVRVVDGARAEAAPPPA